MSASKAFLVAGEERSFARCERLLSRLSATTAEWIQLCERDGQLQQQDAEAVAARLDAFQRMLNKQHFAELQIQIPAEIRFLQCDLQERLACAVNGAAKILQKWRRTARIALLLADKLEQSALESQSEHRRNLFSEEIAERVMTRAFQLLYPVLVDKAAIGPDGASAEERGSYELLIHQSAAVHRDADILIDKYLAELIAFDADASSFTARTAAILCEPPERQSVLEDSLLKDLEHAVCAARETSTQLATLREKAAELSNYNCAAARDLMMRIQERLVAKDTSSTAALAAEAESLFCNRLSAIAADAYRRALLHP